MIDYIVLGLYGLGSICFLAGTVLAALHKAGVL